MFQLEWHFDTDTIITKIFIYTQWTIKTCHFVFDYNSGFSWSILNFLYQWKQEEILYKHVNKIYHFTLTVPPHSLPGKTKTAYKQHIMKSVITVRSIEPVVHNFRRKSSNVHICLFLVGTSFISLLAVKLSHSQVFFYKKMFFFIKKMFSVILKLNVFNFDN